MIDPVLLISIFLLVTASGTLIFYYKRLKRVHDEYIEAKSVLKEIILSFNKDLEKLEGEVESLAERVKSIPPGGYSDELERLRRDITQVRSELEVLLSVKDKVRLGVEEVRRLAGRVEEISEQQRNLAQRLSELERARPELLGAEGAGVKTVIPIVRERALAHLTETELKVLRILADEGERTVSQIRERIKLTREHTARLMKKLYTRGYVERNTERIPYVYRIKKEMLDILRSE